MTVRDELEIILEALEQVKQTEEKLTYLFNKVYADHLKKRIEVEK